jgi:hypothetical protein
VPEHKVTFGDLEMTRLLISFVSWFLLVVSNVPAQEVGSAAAANFLADAANRVAVEKQRWQSTKKITLLKSIPPNPPDQGGEFSKAEEGWVGDVSYWDTEVLDIENEKEMLLKIAKEVIWLKNYPTKEFTTGQKVRIVGPVKAGATKSYVTTAGGQREPLTIEEYLQRPFIRRSRYLLVGKELGRWKQFYLGSTQEYYSTGQLRLGLYGPDDLLPRHLVSRPFDNTPEDRKRLYNAVADWSKLDFGQLNLRVFADDLRIVAGQ